MAEVAVKMQISLEKYEAMQDRIAQLETAIEIKSKQLNYALDLVIEREDVIYALRSKQPHWISVKDRVPESGIGVLVFTDDYCAYTAHYDGYWWLSGEPTLSYDVTHWMPLPAPPEVEDVQG